MAKLFCVSDIHGFYDELITALDEAGFDKDNPEHWLISCGDHFDRGWKPVEVMRFLRSLPRKVIIKGNHELLLKDCCDRGYPEGYDYSNGTVNTIVAFSSAEDQYFAEAASRTWKRVKPFIDEMVNYFETENYVFCHSCLPKGENWREAAQEEWDKVIWGNPYLQRKLNKTIVFGHYHTSWARHHFDGKLEWDEGADFSPYYNNGLFGIDGCVAHTKKCNVLVLEDRFLDEQS